MKETRRVIMLITGHKPDMGEVVEGEKRTISTSLAELLVKKCEAAYDTEEVTNA